MPRLVGAVQEASSETQAETITTFNSSGTLTTQPRTTEITYLVVAGGGAGGDTGGGGGAGGFRTSVPGATSGGGGSAESATPVSGGSPYPVTVGAGSAEVNRGTYGTGSDSVLGTPSPITSAGGGGGGHRFSYVVGGSPLGQPLGS